MPHKNVETAKESAEGSAGNVDHDHGYWTNQVAKENEAPKTEAEKSPEKPAKKVRKRRQHNKLQELQNTPDNREDNQNGFYQTPSVAHSVKHKNRDIVTQMALLYEFLTKGRHVLDVVKGNSCLEIVLKTINQIFNH